MADGYAFQDFIDRDSPIPLYLQVSADMTRRIAEEDTPALELARGVTLGELAERYGDPVSEKVFFLEDYQSYLLNRYIEDRLG